MKMYTQDTKPSLLLGYKTLINDTNKGVQIMKHLQLVKAEKNLANNIKTSAANNKQIVTKKIIIRITVIYVQFYLQ